MQSDASSKTEQNKAIKRDITDAALTFLEHRPRTTQEMRRKLRDGGYEEEEITACLARLTELHYLDDRDYAMRYIRQSLGKRRGRRRFLTELQERGISRDITAQALYDFEDEEDIDLAEAEYQNALAEAAQLLEGRSSDEVTDKLKARAARRLTFLGYETSLIYKVLAAAGKED